MRAIIRLKDGEYINLPADSIYLKFGWVTVWKGDSLIALAKADEVVTAHLSEKKE